MQGQHGPSAQVQGPKNREEVARFTQDDPTLQFDRESTWDKLPPLDERNHTFALAQGVLYRWVEGQSQLVVSQPLHKWTLTLGHKHHHPAGHLASEKTLDRILQRFYWPGIKVHVQRYCATCRECQLNQEQGSWGKNLKAMPLITIPFERVKGIVGLVVQATSHHKFILVFIDYNTRYPEATPLRNMRAETVAKELAQIFIRTGIPKQVVTDEETSFMSEVL